MKSRIISLCLTIIIFFISIYSSVFTVFAEDNPNYGTYGKRWDDLTFIEKAECLFNNAMSLGGKIINLDGIGANQLIDDYISYLNDNYVTDYQKKCQLMYEVEKMTDEQQQEWYNNYVDALNNMGATINENGLKMTDDACKKIRGWLDEYEKNNLQPLYYTVETACIGENNLKASYCGSTYFYKTIKYFVENVGDCFCYTNGDVLVCVPLGDISKNEYFCVLDSSFSDIDVSNGYFEYQVYNGDEILIFGEYHNRNHIPLYYINFGTDKTAVQSLDDERVTHYTDIGSFGPYSYSNAYYSKAVSFPSYRLRNSTINYNYPCIVTKKDRFIKVFTSLSNYQDYISSTYEPQVFYTTNYYKTENIQDSAIPLDQMVNLYNCYDELCQKILQYVKDTQNADDTAVIKKLDELIKAVYSTGSVSGGGSSGGSTDVDVSVDMTETNNILTQILETVKKIANKEIIELPNNTAVDDWGNTVKDMLVNPDTAINNTVNNLATSLSAPFEKLKEKFPFSIPWDIAFLITFLADTPETPKFDIPIKFESYNIDYTLIIDFASFEVVSKISRMLLTLCYMVALIQLTSKVSDIKKGD